MRLLVATLRYPPYVTGGYEILTRDAVEGLRGRGHEVAVVCGRGERFEREGVRGVLPLYEPALPEDGASLFELSHRGTNLDRLRLHFLRLANWRATLRALRATRAEALVFFNLGLVSLAPILAARCAGVPTLGVISDPWPLNHWLRDWSANADGARKQARLAVLERAWRTFRDAVGLGRLCVTSEYLRAELAADGLDPASLRRVPIPLGASMAPDPPVSAPPPRAPGERLRVACTSMLWEGKGVHVLLDAAARAVRAGADLELELAGEGEPAYRARLEGLASAPELAGRVAWRGMLDRAGVDALLRSAHVLAFPSLWGEPYPLATLEAMARGLAVVASDAGGTPEQLADGEQGLVVPAGDAEALAAALARLAADDALRLACGRGALERVAREARPERFLDDLEEELARTRARGPL